jgi:hypothetical protein
MNQPERWRYSDDLEISRLRRTDIGRGEVGFQPLAVLASLSLLISLAFNLGWGFGAAPAFAQLLDTSGQHVYDGAKPFVDWQLSELVKSVPELQGLQAAQSQEELPEILEKEGECVEELLESLPNTSSREEITQERLKRNGRVEARRVESFSFLILTHRSKEKVDLEEYRTDSQGNFVEPPETEGKFSLTKGFASSWLHFHPSDRSASRFSLLGEQELEGRKTYVVAFAQRPGWATIVGRIELNGRSVLVLYQGIAWIDVASYQIVRMRTDLLAPREDVDLERQTTEIEFGEVRFPDVSSLLWLPRDVVVTVETKDRVHRRQTPIGVSVTTESAQILRNRHHYSHYKLFRSESTIKPTEPGQTIPMN